MFDIVTNLLIPVVFVALFVALPLWRVLRAAARDDRRPDGRPADPQPEWIHATAALSFFGPFWYPISIPRRQPAPIDTKGSDLT
jgi:hypothetical protein